MPRRPPTPDELRRKAKDLERMAEDLRRVADGIDDPVIRDLANAGRRVTVETPLLRPITIAAANAGISLAQLAKRMRENFGTLRSWNTRRTAPPDVRARLAKEPYSVPDGAWVPSAAADVARVRIKRPHVRRRGTQPGSGPLARAAVNAGISMRELAERLGRGTTAENVRTWNARRSAPPWVREATAAPPYSLTDADWAN